MELKKSEKANLEKRKGVFFQLGLVIALSLMLIAFDWTSEGLDSNEYASGNQEQIEEEMIPITRVKPPEPPKPPEPQKVIEILQIVEDDVLIIDDLQLKNQNSKTIRLISLDFFYHSIIYLKFFQQQGFL